VFFFLFFCAMTMRLFYGFCEEKSGLFYAKKQMKKKSKREKTEG